MNTLMLKRTQSIPKLTRQLTDNKWKFAEFLRTIYPDPDNCIVPVTTLYGKELNTYYFLRVNNGISRQVVIEKCITYD